jgi:signal transduction histidine kinase
MDFVRTPWRTAAVRPRRLSSWIRPWRHEAFSGASHVGLPRRLLPGIRAPRPVHFYLVLLILGVLLPLLSFSSYLVIRSAWREQDAMAMSARDRTRIATIAIEDEIVALRGRLFVLAGGLSLQTTDLSDFHARAQEAFGGMPVILSNADGREILDTSVSYGDPLPRHPDIATIRDVVATAPPVIAIGNLAEGRSPRRPFVTINLPISRDSQLVYVLSLNISSTLPRILRELDLPEGWVATIFDPQGYMIGRSREAERFVGVLAYPEYRQRIMTEDTGWYPGISREGVPLFNSFAHTKLGGWTVNVGIPRDILLAPVRRTTWQLILLGGATLGLAVVMAVAIGRRIASPIVDLVPIADSVGRGEPVTPRLTGLTEVNLVAHSLFEAGERLRTAAAERGRATAALRESEQMYRALAEDLARVDGERSALLNRVVVAQENERKRIARELHDSLAQYLTALRLKLDTLDPPWDVQGDVPGDVPGDWYGDAAGERAGAPGKDALREIDSLIDDLDLAVHRMAWELRPVALDELGLHSAVDHYLDEWSEMARLPVDRTIDLCGYSLPPAVETTLFRVLQEATTNVLRHAEAGRVGVVLEARGGIVRLIVEDDGKGFPIDEGRATLAAVRQFGLHGMRERLALVHGHLDVETSPETGTTLFIRIPIERNQRGPEPRREAS